MNKYRNDSARAHGWDYRSRAAYFVTIVTKFRAPWFGEIRDGVMDLSDIGRIIDDEWRKTEIIRSYVSLDAYVIMPDHFHGIIRINESSIVGTPRRGVPTIGSTNPFHKSQWKSGSLGSIINQFKSVCTKRICKNHPDFAWQPRFHDRIVRDAAELDRIRRYIAANPSVWKLGDDTWKW